MKKSAIAVRTGPGKAIPLTLSPDFQTTPDWSKHYTVEAFNEEFGGSIRFTGPGFYCSNTDTLLVTPLPPDEGSTEETIWHQRQPEGTIYRVDCYNVPIEQTIFKVCTVAPMRVDKRFSTPAQPVPSQAVPGNLLQKGSDRRT